MYIMGTLLRHGSEAQKARYLPRIASGELRLQAFSVTEAEAGSDTTSIATTARRDGDGYVVDGHKNWTSRIAQSDLLLLLARTAERDERARSAGLSLFLVDLREVRAESIEVTQVRTMFNYATNEVRYRGLRIPAAALIGEEGEGFRYLLDGLNPERILLGAEALGMGRAAIRHAARYAKERIVFDRPIGQNQGIAFPLADSVARLDAAELIVRNAAWRYDRGLPCGREANVAKYLAAEAGFTAADRAMQTLGGMGYATEYHVERYFREARILRLAPVSQEMVLNYVAQHVLDLPRSY
jgi:acyl-CoA dehydrogenase